MPSFNPHSFRNTLAILGEKVCKTPEQFKAWNQNLGHERVLTTFFSYGEVQESRQADMFKGFGDSEEQGVLLSSAKEFARAVAKELTISSTV